MKIYLIYNSAGEKDGTAYPTVPVCDSCVKEYKDSDILVSEVSKYNPFYGNECYLCSKTVQQESEEQKKDPKEINRGQNLWN